MGQSQGETGRDGSSTWCRWGHGLVSLSEDARENWDHFSALAMKAL